ncbi:MAG TPA: galactose mutarotase [Polyangiaceae bacterium]|jgi:galactose mutarotase-like enzyme
MPSSTSALQAIPGDTIELLDGGAGSAVSLVPARGAIVTRFRVGERELLYLDDATLRDPAKNVRGGIPVLFPSPGRLTGDRFARGARSGAMKQHGFARDAAWETRSVAVTDAPSATLVLRATDATRAQFPYDFLLAITFRLSGATLRLDVDVENTGREPLPFAFGLHPYFLVPDADKAAARIATRATRAFDNVTKNDVPFHGFDLTAKEVDLHLVDHGSTDSELTWPDGARLALRASPELTRWVVWTLAGRDFVCVEPWTAPADALNSGESLIELAPGAKRSLWVELAYAAPPGRSPGHGAH